MTRQTATPSAASIVPSAQNGTAQYTMSSSRASPSSCWMTSKPWKPWPAPTSRQLLPLGDGLRNSKPKSAPLAGS